MILNGEKSGTKVRTTLYGLLGLLSHYRKIKNLILQIVFHQQKKITFYYIHL